MPKKAHTPDQAADQSSGTSAEFDPNRLLDPSQLGVAPEGSEHQIEGPVTTSAAPELGTGANSPGAGSGAGSVGNSQFPTHAEGGNHAPATGRILLELPPLVDLSPEELAGYPDVNVEVRLIGPQGLKFRRQHILEGKIVDFYCHELRLKGYKVIRFMNEEMPGFPGYFTERLSKHCQAPPL